jgi:hypothetical protein
MACPKAVLCFLMCKFARPTQVCSAPIVEEPGQFWSRLFTYAQHAGVPLSALLATGGLRLGPSRVAEERSRPASYLDILLSMVSCALHPHRARRMLLPELMVGLKELQVRFLGVVNSGSCKSAGHNGHAMLVHAVQAGYGTAGSGRVPRVHGAPGRCYSIPADHARRRGRRIRGSGADSEFRALLICPFIVEQGLTRTLCSRSL